MFRKLKRRVRLEIALRSSGQAREPHGLPHPVIVSLTSFPPRFGYLRQCLISLLTQRVVPDGVILWIAKSNLHLLPRNVRALERFGLQIRSCETDLRSYNKIIPALEAHPGAFLVTADDDQVYPQDWLAGLLAHADSGRIVFYRGHRIVLNADGTIAPYMQWDWDVADEEGMIVPTGVGGVLYPPGAFDDRVSDRRLFSALSPTSDDLWLYWMAALHGTRHRKAEVVKRPSQLPSGAIHRLWDINQNGGNDAAVTALTKAMGMPVPNG